MADARLVIEIQDDSSGTMGAPAPGPVGSPSASTSPAPPSAFQQFAPPPNSAPAGSSYQTANNFASRPAGSAWSTLSFKDKQAASLNGRPANVSDDEWEQFGKDSARHGQQQAMLAPSRAAAEAKRLAEEEEKRLKKESADRQREQERLAQERLRRRDEEDKQIEANAKAQRTRDAQLAVSLAQQQQIAGGGGSGKYAQRGAAGGAAIGMAVGGPMGAAVGQLVGEEVGKKIDNPLPEWQQKAIRGLGQAAEYAASGLAKVAGNDGVGMFQVAANAATEALDGIPFVGGPAKDAIQTFTKVLSAANVATEAFAQRAREIQGYNGSIAASVAQQDVARIMADIEEANRFGNQFARLIDKQTEFEETMRGLLAPLKEVALEYLPKMMDFLMEFIPAMLERLNHLDPLSDTMKDMAEEAKAARRRYGGDDPKTMFAIDRMLSAARGLSFDVPPRPPAIAPFGIPLVGG